MVRHSNTWVFNIDPENWDECVNGPTDEQIHGAHTGNPWQGLRSDPADGPDMEPGDLVIARITSADGTNPDWGVKGVWEFAEAAPVEDQDDVPWEDADYSWMLYCRPLQRELDTVFQEDFGNEPAFGSSTLQSAAKSLEPEDKADYLQTLQKYCDFNEATTTRITSELESTTPTDPPSVWIEKTYLEGREYKQSGDLALGKAIYSPSQSKNGQDRFKTMRHADVGDIVLHLLQEDGKIVGASRIESELHDDFEGIPEFDWTEDQREAGGYLHWLEDYTEFDSPLRIYADILEDEDYAEPLEAIRQEHRYLPYDKNLELAQGTYLARCPEELVAILAQESEEVEQYLEEAGIEPDFPSGMTLSGKRTETGEEERSRTSFETIAEATTTVLQRLEDSNHPNLLEEQFEKTRIQGWSRALSGFNPADYLSPEDKTELDDLLTVLDDLRPALSDIAADLRIGTLNAAEPYEVVFLALLRDLQENDYVDVPVNANQAKLNALRREAYVTFTNPQHSLIEHLRSNDVAVYSLTAPASYWLTTLRHRAFGFTEADSNQWGNITPGDVFIFHAGGESNHPELESQDGFVFGAAIAGQSVEKDVDWWYDEVEGDVDFSYLFSFQQLYLTPGAATVGDPPAVRLDSDTDALRAAIEALQEDALPMDEVNSISQSLVDSDFAYRSGIDRLEDDTEYGRREGIIDRLAGIITQVTPIAIHREFEGTIPASAFEELHFPVDSGIATAEELAAQITAALRSGDHIIFTGPPGTGKTEVAQAATKHLQKEYPYLYSGSQLTTATADWSTFDTVGGYMPNPDTDGDDLDFHPGVILNRFKDRSATPEKNGLQTNEPIIIDEINRANIDKAFGQLFTTLSGQRVTLPFRLDAAPDQEIEVVPAMQLADSAQVAQPSQFVVPTSWRILGTMNTFDKTSLYELSYAFMRRFTFIRIGVPDIPEEGSKQETFLSSYAHAWGLDPTPQTLRYVAAVWRATNTAVPERSIGPAIVEDILSYVAVHDAGTDLAPRLTEAIVSYIFPQLEGVPEREDIVENIGGVEIVDTDELERAAADMLGVHDLDWDNES